MPTSDLDLLATQLATDDAGAVAGTGGAGDGSGSEQPERVGRFVILDRLGAGGMGVVYSAMDSELQRKVAIKLLHSGPEAGSAGTARMLREAQATAKLSHPNVVQIYEVGTHRGNVYLALEYVEGQNLRSWLAAERRPWAEVCGCFLQAGRGLAAAHAAGLVHRDFKPDNAMLGRDGRVRVLDFGIARVATDEQPIVGDADLAAARDGGLSSASNSDLTATGTIAGSPAYMAPEQFRGAATTPATDQFAFGVSLYEALYGERPFKARTRMSLGLAVINGRRSPIPERDVPAWLRDIVLRCLEPSPADRFASMDDLLAQLEAGLVPPPSFVRRVAAPALVATFAFAAAMVWSLRERPVAVCDGGAVVLAEVWTPDRRAAIEAGFRATELGYAGEAWTHAAARFEELSHSWLDQHRQNCEATRVLAQQSDARMDLRSECLTSWLRDADAVLDVLAEPDEDIVEHARQAIDGLGDPSRCADVEMLEREPSAPPEQAEALAAVHDQLSRLKAERLAGKYEQGPRLDALVEAAEAIAWEPIALDAKAERISHLRRRGLYKPAGEQLAELYYRNLASGRDAAAAGAAIGLAAIHGGRFQDHERAGEWLRAAAALIERLGEPAMLRARLISEQGNLAYLLGDHAGAEQKFTAALAAFEALDARPQIAVAHIDIGRASDRQANYQKALAEFELAIAIQRELLGDDHPDVAFTRRRIAGMLATAGEFERAEAEHLAALATLERALGPEHPRVAQSHLRLGVLYVRREDHERARAEYQRAVDILSAAKGEDTPDIVDPLNNLAGTYISLGQLDQAEATLDRALAIQKQADPKHFKAAVILSTLAVIAKNQGQLERSIELNREALDLMVETLGPDHPNVGIIHANIALTLERIGEQDQALLHHRRALEILEAKYGPEHHELITPLANLAETLAAAKDWDESVALAERALAIELAHDRTPAARAKTRLTVAKLLWGSRRERERARTLIDEALAELEADESEAAASLRDRLLAWKAHPTGPG